MRAPTFQNAVVSDGPRLADLRTEAMRPSLETLGRFNPVRVRSRFLSGFVPQDTQLILTAGQLVGFYVLKQRADHIRLDHLYLRPAVQGTGLGQKVMDRIKQVAARQNRPIRLMALKQSPANAFYEAAGFVFQFEEAFDNHYMWSPPQGTAVGLAMLHLPQA